MTNRKVQILETSKINVKSYQDRNNHTRKCKTLNENQNIKNELKTFKIKETLQMKPQPSN